MSGEAVTIVMLAALIGGIVAGLIASLPVWKAALMTAALIGAQLLLYAGLGQRHWMIDVVAIGVAAIIVSSAAKIRWTAAALIITGFVVGQLAGFWVAVAPA